MSRPRLGEILIAEGRIDAAQLQAALGYQKRWGRKIGECLVQLGFIPEVDLCQVLSKVLKVPVIDLSKLENSRITREILNYISIQMARTNRIVPLAVKDIRGKKRLVVATSDPTNYKVLDELQFKTGLPILPMVTSDSDIEWFIRRHYMGESDALPLSYISGVSPIDDSTAGEKMQIDPVSSIFYDAEFTGMTNINRTNPGVSVSKSKDRISTKKPKS